MEKSLYKMVIICLFSNKFGVFQLWGVDNAVAGTPLSEPLPIGVVVGVGDSMPR